MGDRFNRYYPPDEERYENNRDDILLAQFLEGLSFSKNDDSLRRPEKKKKVNAKYGSQPNLHKSPRQQMQSIQRINPQEVGPYAWVPVATRTAVGYGTQTSLTSRKKRPISAPISRRSRRSSHGSLDSSWSGESWAVSLLSATSHRGSKYKKGYMKKPQVICVRAFQNGTRENYSRVTANGISQLLEECTAKLGLTAAARKMFLPDGTLVISPRQMPKDSDVYVSCGEPFKDPFKEMRDRERMKLASSWTMNGIMLPEHHKKPRKLKASLGKQMKELVESQRRRILVFKNGEATTGVEVVANRFDEFLDDCTQKLNLPSSAKLLFDTKGRQVESFAQVPTLDGLLSAGRGPVLGPVWASRGEGFSPKGVYLFLMTHFQEVKNKIRITKNYKKELQNFLNGDEVKSVEIQAMKKEEALKEKKVTDLLLKPLSALHSSLSKQLKEISKLLKEEESVGRSYKFQHISTIDPNSRLVSRTGLRLKIHLNGDTERSCKVPVNIKDAMKAGKTKEERMAHFFQLLSMNAGLQETFHIYSQQKWFSRAFFSNGTEIIDVAQLEYDSEIWLSYGEDFVPIEYSVFGMSFQPVRLINIMERKAIVVRELALDMDAGQVDPNMWTTLSEVPEEVKKESCQWNKQQDALTEDRKQPDNDNISEQPEQITTLQENSESLTHLLVAKDDGMAVEPSPLEVQPLTLNSETAEPTSLEQNKAVILGANREDELQFMETISNHYYNRISDDGPFLQNKEVKESVVFPELCLVPFGKDQEIGSNWDGLKAWILTSDGFIANKHFNQLVLGIRDTKIKIEDEQNIVQGFKVSLTYRNASNPYQKWTLTGDGCITATANPDLYLTDVSNFKVQICTSEPEEKTEDEQVNETSTPVPPETTNEPVVVPKLETPTSSSSSSSNESITDGSREESDLSDSFLDSLGLKGLKEKAMLRKKTRKRMLREKKGHKEDKNVEPTPAVEQASAEVGELPPVETKSDHLDFIDKLPDEYKGETVRLVIIPRAPAKHPLRASQRWAIQIPRQGSKFPVSNENLSTKWKQQNLMWPAGETGQWTVNTVEGYLLPNAPKLKRILKSQEKTVQLDLPVRLKVLRNGDSNLEHAITVIGPDVSNMTRSVGVNLFGGKKNGKNNLEDPSSSVSDVEFHQFLERCTDQLRLPFAARRLFTEKGKELFSLSTLERDQLVYVSAGEAWTNPDLTLAEQQRRLILANLAGDVGKMKQFIRLRNQTDLILQVDGKIRAGSAICIGPRPLDPDPKSSDDENQTNGELGYSEERMIEIAQSMMTAHQRAHLRSEERLEKLRRSFDFFDIVEENDQGGAGEEDFSNPTLARKFSLSHQDNKVSPDAHQRWVYKGGFIQLKHNPKLVLGLREDSEVKSSQHVVLCAKKLEDPNQRWKIEEDGTIHLRSTAERTLTVATPLVKKDEASNERYDAGQQGYHGAPLLLMPRMPAVYGNAHQVFVFDTSTGYIEAFATDLVNKEITAANKGGICTYAVLGARPIEQLGYELDVQQKGKPKVYLCDSCGKSARGKKKLQKISHPIEFACGMGKAKANGIKFTGSFTCLESTIDLSYREAESTLALWEMQLARLKQESSVRIINQELRASQITPSVRIRANRNGDSGGREGILIIGTTINQLLDQCTVRLGLHQAARRLYTVDGELITDMRQLLQPYYPELFFKDQNGKGLCKNKQKRQKSAKKVRTKSESTDGTDSSACVLYTRPDQVTNESNPDPGINSNNLQLVPVDNSSRTSEEEGEKHVSFADTEQEDEFATEKIFEKMDVRIPVDVWVSVGEPFIPLAESDKAQLISLRQREEKALAMDYLEIEKHRLRQLRGRRYSGMTSNQEQSVKPVLHKSWTEPTKEEEKVEQSIQDLKVHIMEVRTKQSKENPHEKSKRQTKEDCKVYDIPRAIRIHVYPNGEDMARARAVFASNLTELLDRATGRLDLTNAARRLFTSDGNEITTFDEIKKNQYVCVTCGEKYVPHRDRKHKIEMRASWSRMRRSGNQAGNENATPEGLVTPPLALPAPLQGSPAEVTPNSHPQRKKRPKTAKV